jgi:O-antigen ligase
MLSIGSRPLDSWFGQIADNESGSALDRLMLMGLIIAGMLVLVRRRYNCSNVLRRNAWLLILLAYMLVSTLWSDITLIALRQWFREVIVVIMALVIMSETDPRKALESVMRRSAYILIPFSLMLIKYYPALGVSYGRWSGGQAWIGVTDHKNSLGRLCMVSGFFLVWALHRRWRKPAPTFRRCQKWADVSVLLTTLFLLGGTEDAYSATAVAASALGLALFWALLLLQKLNTSLPRNVLLALVLFSIVFGVAAPFERGSNVAMFSATFGRNKTLTGRTDTWTELVPLVWSKPLLGCGFGSFWTTARRDFYQMSNGHNGYLDTLLELGSAGLALYVAWLMSCARKFHSALAENYEWASLTICYLIMALVYNATESTLNDLSQFVSAVVAVVSITAVPYGTVLNLRHRATSHTVTAEC